ncbi:MAG: hypothetical protein AAGK78_08035, partial [Planctomycetota bacterium]
AERGQLHRKLPLDRLGPMLLELLTPGTDAFAEQIPEAKSSKASKKQAEAKAAIASKPSTETLGDGQAIREVKPMGKPVHEATAAK